ncbi:MAG TPA: NifB/NifX family molybdenum-iron cluster-binding protein [Terriglobales bacterium]|jgi:predicted Fe-Mo cluster-binding NifX family protein|nr:NifB/NifX family molybdenum-iron cluster-binding protein [Terriglobales bacterium]
MSKMGFTTLLNRVDSVLSPHFGKAKWVMIRDDETGKVTFEQNTDPSGRAVVNILRSHGCTEAVFTEIGPGAFRHLQEAGIRGWIAPANVPVTELLERLTRRELFAAMKPTSHRAGAGHTSNGCGATEAPGIGVGRATGCCGQQGHRHGDRQELVRITDEP